MLFFWYEHSDLGLVICAKKTLDSCGIVRSIRQSGGIGYHKETVTDAIVGGMAVKQLITCVERTELHQVLIL